MRHEALPRAVANHRPLQGSFLLGGRGRADHQGCHRDRSHAKSAALQMREELVESLVAFRQSRLHAAGCKVLVATLNHLVHRACRDGRLIAVLIECQDLEGALPFPDRACAAFLMRSKSCSRR